MEDMTREFTIFLVMGGESIDESVALFANLNEESAPSIR
jgi:hypothetical protein